MNKGIKFRTVGVVLKLITNDESIKNNQTCKIPSRTKSKNNQQNDRIKNGDLIKQLRIQQVQLKGLKTNSPEGV